MVVPLQTPLSTGIDFSLLFTQCHILHHREEVGTSQHRISTRVGVLLTFSMLPPKFYDLETKHHLPPFHRFAHGIAVKEADKLAIFNPGSWSDELVHTDLNVLFLKRAEDPV